MKDDYYINCEIEIIYWSWVACFAFYLIFAVVLQTLKNDKSNTSIKLFVRKQTQHQLKIPLNKVGYFWFLCSQ